MDLEARIRPAKIAFWVVVALLFVISLIGLALLLDRSAPELAGYNLLVVPGGILFSVSLLIPTVFTRRHMVHDYGKIDAFDSDVRHHHRWERVERVERVIEGRVVPLCPVNELLFSPFSARACVLWAVEMSRSRWPINDGGRARVCKSIPFGVETSSGTVRVECVETVVVPRIEGFARVVGGGIDERVRLFYENVGGDRLRRYEAACMSAPRSENYVQTFELAVPVYSHIRMYTVVYDGSQDWDSPPADLVTAKFAYVASAKVFVGSPEEITARISGSLTSALRHRREIIIGSAGLLFASLVYVALVLLDYIN